GDGTTTDSTTPIQVGGLSGVIAVAAGVHCTVALKSDGTVQAWGSYEFDEEEGGAEPRVVYTTPVLVKGLSGVIAIGQSAWLSMLAVLDNGTVRMWGEPSGPLDS